MRWNIGSCGFRYPRYLHFHKKWDRDVRRIPSHWKYWRRMFYARMKRPVKQLENTLPDGYQSVNIREFMAADRLKDRWEDPFIWPYEQKFEKGTKEDPNYKKVMAHHFDRRTTILEGFKGAMSFTNTVMEKEDNFPNGIANLEKKVTIDPQISELLKRRLTFAFSEDATLIRLPNIGEFPRIDLKRKVRFGAPPPRIETNIINAYYETALHAISKHHGFIDRRRLNHPSILLPFQRDDQLAVADLSCEFITLAQKESDDYVVPAVKKYPVYSDPSKTIDKEVISIFPCNWEICFDKSHWYSTDFRYMVPLKDKVHTIYLTDATLRTKKFVDRFYKGRALMFCYGYAAAQYRFEHGNWDDYKDPINYQVLKTPIILNSVFVNLSKNSIGFCCFQLNTTSFDSEIKNQVWFHGPFSISEQQDDILKKIMAINLYGPYNQPFTAISKTESQINLNTEETRTNSNSEKSL